MLNILDAICGKLETRYPAYPIYVQRIPQNFTAPSILVDPVSVRMVDATRYTVRYTETYTVACFVPMDEYGNCDDVLLYQFQRELFDLFSDGYIVCGDRCPHITTENGEHVNGEAHITITVVYDDDRSELPGDINKIKDINVNYHV